jgi:hypothetical protein
MIQLRISGCDRGRHRSARQSSPPFRKPFDAGRCLAPLGDWEPRDCSIFRLRASWEYVHRTYWAVPSAMAVVAIILSVAMIHVNEALTAARLERLSWVYTGGPEGARAVLSTLAGSMMTVAGVTFSIMIVALTLASPQFRPRLLRNFLRIWATRSYWAHSCARSCTACSCCGPSAGPMPPSSCRISP